MNRRPRALLGCALLMAAMLLTPQPVEAQTRWRSFDLSFDPQTLALAGATIAQGIGFGAMENNPATLLQVHQYTVVSGYRYASDPTEHAVSLGAADSLVNPNMGGGFIYTFDTAKVGGKRVKAHRLLGSVALMEQFNGVQLLAGMNFRWNKLSGGAAGNGSYLNLDAGAALVIGNVVRLGFVAANILDRKSKGESRGLGTGAAFTYSMVQVEYDLRVDLDAAEDKSRLDHAVGVQVAPMNMLALRAGWRRDGVRETNTVSGGFEYIHPAFSFGFAYAQEVSDPLDPSDAKRRWIGALFRYFVTL